MVIQLMDSCQNELGDAAQGVKSALAVRWRKGVYPGAKQTFNFIGETGAGEGIRTLDPNLGKVVLYP